MRSRACRGAAAALLTLVTACSAGSETPADTTSPAPSSTTGTTPTTVAVESSTVSRRLHTTAEQLPSAWVLVAEIPYGTAEAELGLADDHGGQGPAWGPEYAAPDQQGRWWVLDSHKRRVARFDHAGRFLGATDIPGPYAEFQLPFVVGTTFWASGGQDEALVADETSARRVPVAGSWPYSDGSRLYRADRSEVLDPTGPLVPEDTEAMLTPAGTPFLAQLVGAGGTDLEVMLPEAGRRVVVDLVTAADEPPEVVVFEVQADVTDRLLFFVSGLAGDEQLAGFFTVDATSGAVSDAEPMRDPFSASDPGSPAHLRVIPDTTSASLTFVDTDALRIYRRDWPERPFAAQ